MNKEFIKLANLFAQLTTEELYRRRELYNNLNNFRDVLAREMIERELDTREIFNKVAWHCIGAMS